MCVLCVSEYKGLYGDFDKHRSCVSTARLRETHSVSERPQPSQTGQVGHQSTHCLPPAGLTETHTGSQGSPNSLSLLSPVADPPGTDVSRVPRRAAGVGGARGSPDCGLHEPWLHPRSLPSLFPVHLHRQDLQHWVPSQHRQP